jgi:Xaa-Pro aminopeptidase
MLEWTLENNMSTKLSNIRTLLTDHSLDAIFISSLPNITYLTGYSGFSTQDRDAFLLITKDHQFIFTHGIYKEDVQRKVTDFTLVQITRENPIGIAVKNAITNESITKLGFEAFDLKVSEYDRLIRQIDKNILSPTNLVNQLRIIKSDEEIGHIQKACALGDKAFSYVLKKIRTGISENELAAELEFYVKSHGADVSFPTIVAFEENAAHPHHIPTDRKLKTENFVLMDFGVLLNGYCSDMTRTVSFGKTTSEKKRIYQTVLTAQQQTIDTLDHKLVYDPTKKIRASSLDTIAREYIISRKYPSMPHSLGHGIGLEVHEAPRLTTVSEEKLEDGMVFSIEPGIYLPDVAGVRIEDLFALKNGKLTQLTTSPRDLLEL